MLLSSIASAAVGGHPNHSMMNANGHSSDPHAMHGVSSTSDVLGKRKGGPSGGVNASLGSGAAPNVIATSIASSMLSSAMPMISGAAFARET